MIFYIEKGGEKQRLGSIIGALAYLHFLLICFFPLEDVGKETPSKTCHKEVLEQSKIDG